MQKGFLLTEGPSFGRNMLFLQASFTHYVEIIEIIVLYIAQRLSVVSVFLQK